MITKGVNLVAVGLLTVYSDDRHIVLEPAETGSPLKLSG